MSEIISKAEDCYKLARKLQDSLESKIDFYGVLYIDVLSGKYLSEYRKNNGEHIFEGNGVPFFIKFSDGEFLRISIASNYQGSEFGEKMAVLSDFYEVLSEEFGEPTVFYTTKDDTENKINLQWCFMNKEEEIEKFKDNSYFDDAEVDKLVVIGDTNSKGHISSSTMKKIISKQVGLPFELLNLSDEDTESFIKYKTGKTY